MTAWWEALSTLQRVLYCIAVPATLLLLLQTVMVIIGFGDGGGGADFNPSDTSGLDLDTAGDAAPVDFADMDELNPADLGSLKLFTVQGVVAFLTTFSWVALVCVRAKLPDTASLLIGFVCGAAMMYGIAKLLQLMGRLAENGTFHLKSAIGETAQVYVMILPSGEGGGKITLSGVSRFAEVDAITEEEQPIPSGARVRIVDVRGDVAVVERDM